MFLKEIFYIFNDIHFFFSKDVIAWGFKLLLRNVDIYVYIYIYNV